MGFFLATVSASIAQSSFSHTVKIMVLRPNEMILAENAQQKELNIFNLKWKSHNQGQKITVVAENDTSKNKIKMVAFNISEKANYSEIPITAVPINLISRNCSTNGNYRFQFITNTIRRKDKNETQPTVMYTLTDT